MLEEVAVASGVLEVEVDDYPFMEDDLKRRCKDYLPNPETVIKSEEAAEAYLFLKHKLSL